MAKNSNEKLRHIQKLKKKKFQSQRGESDVPIVCKHCPNYQPEFRYRTCLYARCPGYKGRSTFRRKPLSSDPFTDAEVVKLRV